MGNELMQELLELIVKMDKHCINMPNLRTDDKCKCVDCAFSRYYTYTNSGCILQQIKHEGLLDDLILTMKQHGIEYGKYIEKITDI